MKYPNWLPYPRYIIKSFLLLLEAGLALAISQVAIALIAIPLLIGGEWGVMDAIATLWLLLWGIIVPIFIFAQCDRLIWHRPKRWDNLGWLPHNRSCGEGIFAYFALAIAFGIPATIVVIITGPSYISPELTDEQITALVIVVITITAYIYHLGGFLHRWQQATFKPKPARRPTSKKAKPAPKPMSDIDRELEELKRKLREK